MAAITIEKLTKYYNNSCVVNDVELKIRNGEFFILVGPSGSGKSTILRLIAGLTDLSSGDIKFDGNSVKALDPQERNIAMVFQSYALYPHKNVYDNIAFGLRARKVPENDVDRHVREAAGILGIDHLLKRWPKELSGGEKQRVAIGRAIVRHPEVYLLDEPLSNLDAQLRTDMRNEIAKLHSRLGTTFVYVTHDQTEAMTLGDRIAVINDGKIEQIDNPAELYDHPVNQFVAGFIGSPPMNFIKGKFACSPGEKIARVETHGGTIVLEGKFENSISLPDGASIILGIRPDAIGLTTPGKGSIEAHVERLEPVGHEGFLYLNLLGSGIVARVQDWQRYTEVRAVGVGLHIDNVYFFLEEDGKCVWGKGKAI